MLNIHISNNNTPIDIIYDLMEIERNVYLPHQRGEFDSIRERFEKNREMLALVYEEDQLIGYLCFFPVSKQLHSQIVVDGLFRDDDILAQDVEDYTSCTYLYIISIAILPDYQNGSPVRMLTSALWNFLRKKEEEDVCIQDITASAVTPDGEHFLYRTGFELIHDHGNKGYKIFRMNRGKLEDVLY